MKDANETEVTDGERRSKSNSLDRTVSSSPVSHIEIITDISEYKKIAETVRDSQAGLLLVQKQAVKR